MFEKTTLKNGLRILTVPMKNTKTLTVLVLVAAGSRYERENTNGLSHFLEHMFFKGSRKRPSTLELAGALDRVGGAYNAFTGKEHTGFWAKTTAEHGELALDWLSDLVLHPLFREEDIEKEKGVIIEEIKMHRDTPLSYVADLWEEVLYGNQPAGWLIIGKEKNINRFKKEDVYSYFKSQYSPKNTVVCLAGKIDDKIFEKAKNYFEEFEKSEPGKKEKVQERQERPNLLLSYKETDQTHLCLGVRGFDMFDKRRYAQLILATILGGNMSSRLFITIRVKEGLAYYVHTSAETYTDTGYLVTQAGVAHKNVKKTISLILKEYRRIGEGKISQTEIRKAKDYIKGSTVLSLETSEKKASFFAFSSL